MRDLVIENEITLKLIFHVKNSDKIIKWDRVTEK